MKINNRMLLAFVLVIGVAVTVMALTSRFYVGNIFDRYAAGYRSVLTERWEQLFRAYYAYNGGSWEGVEELLVPRPRAIRMFGRHGAMGHVGIIPGERLFLADADGRVILDSLAEKTGETLSLKLLQQGAPIIHNGKLAGTLVLQPRAAVTAMTLEEEYSRSVFWAILWGGFAALLAGAVLSYLLTRQITRPLALLAASAQKFARRDFRHRVQLKRKDEIGNLAEAYNLMAESIEKNEKLRGNLLADISHELRTPLTILRGNFEALQAGKTETTPELLSSLYDEVLRLGRLVNDLECINLAEAGKLPLHFREVEPALLIARAAAAFQHEANERKIVFTVDAAKDLLPWRLDEDRVTQVIINLLANAFKFTPAQGEIKLQAKVEKEGLIIEVSDSGPGIPEKALPYIFTRFYKSGKGRREADEKGEGSGIGLSIAKSFVEAHGGTINARNRPEGGSVFSVTLPM
jgi:two-component system OmpR family sensor kinase/two-component system sensor histidine kinase BaeS